MANPTATFATTLGSFSGRDYLDQMPVKATNSSSWRRRASYDGLAFTA